MLLEFLSLIFVEGVSLLAHGITQTAKIRNWIHQPLLLMYFNRKIHDVCTSWRGSRWLILFPYPGCCQMCSPTKSDDSPTQLTVKSGGWLSAGHYLKIFLRMNYGELNCSCFLHWLYPELEPELFIWLCLRILYTPPCNCKWSNLAGKVSTLSFVLCCCVFSYLSFFF